MTLTVEHIDPRRGKLVCGLENEFNEVMAENSYNAGKQNRFVPYRVKDHPAPITYGDIAEFLIEGEWKVCEFGGVEWKNETRRIGFGSMDAWEIIKNEEKGIFSLSKDERKKNSSRGGQTAWREKRGWFDIPEEEAQLRRSRAGKEAAKRKVGAHGRNLSQHQKDSSKGGTKAMSQKWRCLETGFISTAANLAKWQRRRGIDTSRKEKVS